MGHQFDCTKVKLITRLAHAPKRGPWGFSSARFGAAAALSQIALQAALSVASSNGGATANSGTVTGVPCGARVRYSRGPVL
jgi:hypothetical protein